MAFCPNCGRPVSEQSSSCPNCLKVQPSFLAPAPAAHPLYSLTMTSQAMLSDKMAGSLTYLVIPAIIFLVTEPYSHNRFVRFHSFQCLFSLVALALIGFALAIVTALVANVLPDGKFVGLLWPLCGIAVLAAWLVLIAKAYQHEVFKLPVVGKLAEKQAGF